MFASHENNIDILLSSNPDTFGIEFVFEDGYDKEYKILGIFEILKRLQAYVLPYEAVNHFETNLMHELLTKLDGDKGVVLEVDRLPFDGGGRMLVATLSYVNIDSYGKELPVCEADDDGHEQLREQFACDTLFEIDCFQPKKPFGVFYNDDFSISSFTALRLLMTQSESVFTFKGLGGSAVSAEDAFGLIHYWLDSAYDLCTFPIPVNIGGIELDNVEKGDLKSIKLCHVDSDDFDYKKKFALWLNYSDGHTRHGLIYANYKEVG